jgi:hypothetical protein
MNFMTLAGIYCYAMDYHDGQDSRLYRLMSRINFNPTDGAIKAIAGNRHDRQNLGAQRWEEWEDARAVYRQLKRRGAK